MEWLIIGRKSNIKQRDDAADKRKESREELKEVIKKFWEIRDERRALQRAQIILGDPDAPICLNCSYCEQMGFLFYCPFFQFPEDGKIVGYFGLVYYLRKGRAINYPDTPMKPEDCELYAPMVPCSILKKLLNES